ncbi:Uncharacterized protein HZ326_22414 [Fusarium oxysporum f. sp. albedinis]|nr:Uncharacterized protein HZ326_22414 [Fusarium oxysporum f. sp. albedinis]
MPTYEVPGLRLHLAVCNEATLSLQKMCTPVYIYKVTLFLSTFTMTLFPTLAWVMPVNHLVFPPTHCLQFVTTIDTHFFVSLRKKRNTIYIYVYTTIIEAFASLPSRVLPSHSSRLTVLSDHRLSTLFAGVAPALLPDH